MPRNDKFLFTTGERRTAPLRFPVSPALGLRCDATFLGESGFQADGCTAVNLGPGGVALHVPVYRGLLDVGTKALLRFESPRGRFALTAKARHMHYEGFFKRVVGFEFQRDEAFDEASVPIAELIELCRAPG